MNIGEQLQALELEILSRTTRKDAARVSSLLADDFREFGSSGRVYTKEDTVLALLANPPAFLSLENFEMKLLAEDVALVTYRSLKGEHGAPPTTALRSSIWIRVGQDWQIIFHQGTKIPSVRAREFGQ